LKVERRRAVDPAAEEIHLRRADDARARSRRSAALIDGIDVATPVGLRDRTLIGFMVYSFARRPRHSFTTYYKLDIDRMRRAQRGNRLRP
jgi:hypothetical protein